MANSKDEQSDRLAKELFSIKNEDIFEQVIDKALNESPKNMKVDDPVVFLKSFFKTKEFKPHKKKFKPPK